MESFAVENVAMVGPYASLTSLLSFYLFYRTSIGLGTVGELGQRERQHEQADQETAWAVGR